MKKAMANYIQGDNIKSYVISREPENMSLMAQNKFYNKEGEPKCQR